MFARGGLKLGMVRWQNWEHVSLRVVRLEELGSMVLVQGFEAGLRILK